MRFLAKLTPMWSGIIQGLREAVTDLPPVEFRLGPTNEEGPLVKLWVDECEIGFPTKTSDSVSFRTPR